MDTDRSKHWETVFTTKADTEVSWYEEVPEASLSRIEACNVARDTPIIDVGGGSSALVDHLLRRGHTDVTVLDVSGAALERARARVGPDTPGAHWVVADVTRFVPSRRYGLWHDRAAFHFLTDPGDQQAYANVVDRAVSPGGWVIVATFAPDGPTRCSGLDVQRHDGASISRVLGPAFTLVDADRVQHRTPSGATQAFTFARLRKSTEGTP